MGRWTEVLRMFSWGGYLPPFSQRKPFGNQWLKSLLSEKSVNQSLISVSSNKWKWDKLDGLKQVKSVHIMTLEHVGKSVPLWSVSWESKAWWIAFRRQRPGLTWSSVTCSGLAAAIWGRTSSARRPLSSGLSPTCGPTREPANSQARNKLPGCPILWHYR